MHSSGTQFPEYKSKSWAHFPELLFPGFNQIMDTLSGVAAHWKPIPVMGALVGVVLGEPFGCLVTGKSIQSLAQFRSAPSRGEKIQQEGRDPRVANLETSQ